MPLRDADAVGIEPIRAYSASLADLATTTSLDTPVPTCGEWVLADLLWHVAEVQTFWAYIIEHRPDGPEGYDEPARPADGRLAPALSAATARLTDALTGVDPDETAWSWADEQTVGFTLRRQSHEALIHLVDGLLATDRPMPVVDTALAVDGVDEMVDVILTGVPEGAVFERRRGVAGLRCTDADARWTLGFGRAVGGATKTSAPIDVEAIQPTSEEPDVVITAEAFTLDCWLWGRAPDETLTIDGDASLAQRLRNLIGARTQ